MSEERARNQTEVFERVKRSIAAKLDDEMLRWDFSRMLEELGGAIDFVRLHYDKKNPKRFFVCKYLGMREDRCKEVSKWLIRESEMSAADISTVLFALKTLKDSPTGGIKKTDSDKKPVAAQVLDQPTSGLVRRIIDHATGSFNSIVGLLVEAGVKPEHAYDSDRMQIQDAIQKICDSLGIAVSFPESEAAFGQPLSRRDLDEIGFRRTERRMR